MKKIIIVSLLITVIFIQEINVTMIVIHLLINFIIMEIKSVLMNVLANIFIKIQTIQKKFVIKETNVIFWTQKIIYVMQNVQMVLVKKIIMNMIQIYVFQTVLQVVKIIYIIMEMIKYVILLVLLFQEITYMKL